MLSYWAALVHFLVSAVIVTLAGATHDPKAYGPAALFFGGGILLTALFLKTPNN